MSGGLKTAGYYKSPVLRASFFFRHKKHDFFRHKKHKMFFWGEFMAYV